MAYSFDDIIDRKGTNSLKYDFAIERGRPEGVLPLWVADMDFKAPPKVIEALKSAAEHGIFGYSEVKKDYFDALYNWFSTRFDFRPEPEWLLKTPGVVFAISVAIRAFTKPGDAVLIQKPVYYPFTEVIQDNERSLVNNELVYENGSYHIDFEDFEEKIKSCGVKLFILCNPHNPVGRVWTLDELSRMGDICLKHGVIVVSDEIHADFTYKGYRHHIFSSLKPEFKERSIICTAPSKTFNLAGLQVSNIIIANREIRKAFKKEIDRTGYSQLNTMGLVACQAAYTYGGQWLDELKEYLAGNLEFVRSFIHERIPRIKVVEPQGTYLLWLDFKALNLKDKELEDLIINKAGLWLDGGRMFGDGGSGFQRMNIACPRSVLERALTQLETAVNSIQ